MVGQFGGGLREGETVDSVSAGGINDIRGRKSRAGSRASG